MPVHIKELLRALCRANPDATRGDLVRRFPELGEQPELGERIEQDLFRKERQRLETLWASPLVQEYRQRLDAILTRAKERKRRFK